MEKKHLDRLRSLGDVIASGEAQQRDRLLREMNFARGTEYWKFREALDEAMTALPKPERNAYFKVFEEYEEGALDDWSLARDLLLLRVYEQIQRQRA